jgi:hypothetical protein
MNLEQYEYVAGKSNLDFEFYSDGPNGKIKKIARFSKIISGIRPVYNLVFGDWNEKTNRIDDFVVTNNLDAEKILATVAMLVVRFTDNYPNTIIYAEGSTSARTRRYQMGINKYWRKLIPYLRYSD